MKDFCLPDLRGRFLRGVDEGTGRDPDAGARTESQTGGNSGDDVGSLEGDSLASHSHTWRSIRYSGVGNYVSGFDFGLGVGVSYYSGVRGDVTATGPVEQTGGSETRPVNAYVIYIIKH